MVSLGVYPEVPLAKARERREEKRKGHAAGATPSEQRKAVKAEAARMAAAGLPGPGTFEHTARAWHDYTKASWSTGHAGKVLALLQNDLFPFLGTRPLAEVTAPELLQSARRIEARGAVETAYRAIKVAGAVFRYGVQHGLCASDPSRDLKGGGVLPVAKHRAAITDPAKLGDLLRAIDTYQGTPVVRAALALAPLVFPSPRSAQRPMSDNGVLSALRRMGYGKDEMTGHGFRAMARTMAVERLGIDPDVAEAQLAHAVGDSLGRAYNRTQFLEQRREMMTKWADYLDRLREGAQVLPFKAA